MLMCARYLYQALCTVQKKLHHHAISELVAHSTASVCCLPFIFSFFKCNQTYQSFFMLSVFGAMCRSTYPTQILF